MSDDTPKHTADELRKKADSHDDLSMRPGHYLPKTAAMLRAVPDGVEAD